MVDLKANQEFWSAYDWPKDGEEWSWTFGGGLQLWNTMILPRVKQFLPAKMTLEIAVGHGRVSQYLIPLSGLFYGVDIIDSAISFCRERFRNEQAIFLSNDGMTIPLPRDFIDFAMSWDSLVHVDASVMRAYIGELARVLVPGGVAFLHHGNLGAFAEKPQELHMRDESMSAELVVGHCEEFGLSCKQELVDWGDSHNLDCFSTIRKSE